MNAETTVVLRDDALYAGVARVTNNLHDALRELGLDKRLARVAGNTLPDACLQLDDVARLGENAAHRTLDLVEEGRSIANGLGAVHSSLEAMQTRLSAAPQVLLADELQSAMAAVAEGEARLRGTLTLLAQTQEYQDLSGQVIKRIITMVRVVEGALVELLAISGVQDAGATPIDGGETLDVIEPVLPAADQQDADSLMASLGF